MLGENWRLRAIADGRWFVGSYCMVKGVTSLNARVVCSSSIINLPVVPFDLLKRRCGLSSRALQSET